MSNEMMMMIDVKLDVKINKRSYVLPRMPEAATNGSLRALRACAKCRNHRKRKWDDDDDDDGVSSDVSDAIERLFVVAMDKCGVKGAGQERLVEAAINGVYKSAKACLKGEMEETVIAKLNELAEELEKLADAADTVASPVPSAHSCSFSCSSSSLEKEEREVRLR